MSLQHLRYRCCAWFCRHVLHNLFSFSVLRVRFYINKQINVYLLKLIKTVTNLQTLISVVLFVRSFIRSYYFVQWSRHSVQHRTTQVIGLWHVKSATYNACAMCIYLDPPHFVVRPDAVYQKQLSQSVTMPCIANGDPTPTVSWHRVYILLFLILSADKWHRDICTGRISKNCNDLLLLLLLFFFLYPR